MDFDRTKIYILCRKKAKHNNTFLLTIAILEQRNC